MPSWWGKSSSASSSASPSPKSDKKQRHMRLQIGGWKSKLAAWGDDERRMSSSSPNGSSSSASCSRPISPCSAAPELSAMAAPPGKQQPWPLPPSGAPFSPNNYSSNNNTNSNSGQALPLPPPTLESASSSLSSSSSIGSEATGHHHQGAHPSSSISARPQADDCSTPRSCAYSNNNNNNSNASSSSSKLVDIIKSPCPSPRAILDAGEAFRPLFANTSSSCNRDRSPGHSPVRSPRFCFSPCAANSGQVSPRHQHHQHPQQASPPSFYSAAAGNAPSFFLSSSPRCERLPATTRWQKGKLLGCGSFGNVYVGFDSDDMGRMCAMKEVHIIRDDGKSKASAEQLGQEVRVLSGLRHPNIVQYYGSECVEENLYIYLEYVSGGSIHKLLQDYGPFKRSVIRIYTRQILCGLAYLHSVNTVHRDIKGANILVDTNGTVKLADFGMAKHMTAQSAPMSCKGSPYWMAPEIITQAQRCDLSVDIWSLGCTVIEMATGKPPWSEYEGVAAMFKIVNSREVPPIPDCLWEDGTDFLRLCLQKNPADRPTAAQLLEHPFVADVQEHSNMEQPSSPLARGAAAGNAMECHSRSYVSPVGTPPRNFSFRGGGLSKRNIYGEPLLVPSLGTSEAALEGAASIQPRMLDLRCS